MASHRTGRHRCSIDCPECLASDGDWQQARGPLSGRALVLSSLLTFLLPLAAAVAGAWVGDRTPTSELAGALGGLGLGMLVVRALVRSGWRRGGERP